jgi:hypothetical protein
LANQPRELARLPDHVHRRKPSRGLEAVEKFQPDALGGFGTVLRDIRR